MGTCAAMTVPMGASQFAPPIAVTTPGSRSLTIRAIAMLGTFCANIEVNPTTSAPARS
jgi:hypothetical protein